MEGLLSTGPTPSSFLPFGLGSAVKSSEEEEDSVNDQMNASLYDGVCNNPCLCPGLLNINITLGERKNN